MVHEGDIVTAERLTRLETKLDILIAQIDKLPPSPTCVANHKDHETRLTKLEGWRNKIILSSGVFQLWPSTYELWMFKSDDLAKQNALDLTRKAKMFVSYTTQLSYLRRLQIVVRNDNSPAMRWARLIGFDYEATLTAYTPDGVDCHIYTRFNHGFSGS